jgi:tRNA U34 5-carboxymethylaminomethyl modifying GTPase MnmE/TrmE
MSQGNSTAAAAGCGTLAAYAHYREQVLHGLDKLRSLEPAQDALLSAWRTKLRTNTFNLVVVGQFKRGKTCLINALLGSDLLPVAVLPLTSIVTILTYGDAPAVHVHFMDGRVVEIALDALADYVTEAGNARNVKGVREVIVTYPSPYLQDGVRLIDTPGVGSVYLHNTDAAYRFLPQCDAVLFLLSVEQPASQAELDFLRDVQEHSAGIFFLLNKIDILTAAEEEASLEFARQVLVEVMGPDVKLFPISAKLALEAKLAGAAEALARSKLAIFEEHLQRFLIAEKGRVLLLSVIGNLLRLLAQARLQAELELKSLTIPLADLRERLAAFETKKQEIMRDKDQLEVLLQAEVQQLLKSHLDEALVRFRGELTAALTAAFDAFYENHRDLPLKELNEALEQFIAEETRQAFDSWRVAQESNIARAFEDLCRRFATRTQEAVDLLCRFSSELFAVPYESGVEESFWVPESAFTYKLKEEPVALEMIATQATLTLPGLISERFQRLKRTLFHLAHKLLSGKMKNQLVQSIDVQSGRIRYDLTERLHKSQLLFRRSLAARMEWALEGIGNAIESGMAERAKGETEARARERTVTAGLEERERLHAELMRLRACLLNQPVQPAS